MIELNAGNYQAWYNVLFLILIGGTGVAVWMHEFKSRWTELFTEVIVGAWAAHAILLLFHHWIGIPNIH